MGDACKNFSKKQKENKAKKKHVWRDKMAAVLRE